MQFVELLKVILLGILEGFTEWLPISSTGHLILVNDIIHLRQPDEYYEVFEVVIQLGAILAVLLRFFKTLWPFGKAESKGKIGILPSKIILWLKIVFACIPAAVIGILFNDLLDEYLYNGFVVALMLIIYGVFFIILEKRNEGMSFRIKTLEGIDFQTAFGIGLFQCLALIPGTSRSGATILGAMLLSVSRISAAEFSFFLSVPVMFGASLLKIIKYGFNFTPEQLLYLVVGMLVAFLVSLYCIDYLIRYVRTHSFAIFGYYRIILGMLILAWFVAGLFV